MVIEVESTLYPYHILHWCWISIFNGLYYESFLNYCIFILDEKNDLSLFLVCQHYWICYIRTLIAMLYFYHNEQICLLWLCSKDSYIPPLDRFCIEKQDFFFHIKVLGTLKFFTEVHCQIILAVAQVRELTWYITH